MRKTIFLAMVICFIFCGVSLARQAPDKQFKEPFAGWQKLDGQSKILWKDIVNVEVEVFIRTNVPVGQKQKEVFESIGFKYRSVIPYLPAGSIVTGTISAYALKDLAGLSFVDVIEGAVQVTTKK